MNLPRTIDVLRASSFGVFYRQHLRQYAPIQSLARITWRVGFPLYVRIYVKMHPWVTTTIPYPLVTHAAYAEQTATSVTTLAEARTVTVPPCAVFPAADPPYFTQKTQYHFPAVITLPTTNTQVNGSTNFILAKDAILCHDLYDFIRDYTSEELHARCIIRISEPAMFWLMNQAEDDAIPEAASFLDSCSGNYAHWMTEVLPRIHLFCRDPRFAHVPILVDEKLHANQLASLEAVRGDHPVILLKANQPLRITTLHVVSPSGYIPFERRTNRLRDYSHGVFSPAALQAMVDTIRQSVPVSATPLPKKIIIRRNSGIRLVTNAAVIEQQLVAQGFTVIEPEKLSFAEQVQLFSQVETVVAATGAACANLIFCPPTANIVIMISKHPAMPYGYWQHMAAAVSRRITYVLGEIESVFGCGIHGNFHVALQDVMDAVASGSSSRPVQAAA